MYPFLTHYGLCIHDGEARMNTKRVKFCSFPVSCYVLSGFIYQLIHQCHHILLNNQADERWDKPKEGEVLKCYSKCGCAGEIDYRVSQSLDMDPILVKIKS